jgi:hypothetical protein
MGYKSHKKVEQVDKKIDDKIYCLGGGFSRNGEYLIVGMFNSSTLYLYKQEKGKFSLKDEKKAEMNVLLE